MKKKYGENYFASDVLLSYLIYKKKLNEHEMKCVKIVKCI